jgi:hypothetical protein
MTHGITAPQARRISVSDMVIYNEIDTISRAVMAAALAGDLQVTVDDNSTMTESTPIVTVTGTVLDPTVTHENTVIIDSVAVIIGDGHPSHPHDVYFVASEINQAAIPGVTASVSSDLQLVLTKETTQTNWSIVIGAGTANAELGLTAGTVTATSPESTEYYSVWSGTTSDRKKSYELTEVINHFQGMGYSILAKLNSTTPVRTIKWEIYW